MALILKKEKENLSSRIPYNPHFPVASIVKCNLSEDNNQLWIVVFFQGPDTYLIRTLPSGISDMYITKNAKSQDLVMIQTGNIMGKDPKFEGERKLMDCDPNNIMEIYVDYEDTININELHKLMKRRGLREERINLLITLCNTKYNTDYELYKEIKV
jgi:hypothetical protein